MKLSEYVIKNFSNDQSALFYFTSKKDEELITRTIEFRDNVIPSSNSIMAKNLFKLYHYFDKQEYFETPEIQKTIRKGFNALFTGEIQVAPPFDKCCIVGPILNEGGLDELRQKLKRELRQFFNRRPAPLNVDADTLDSQDGSYYLDYVNFTNTPNA